MMKRRSTQANPCPGEPAGHAAAWASQRWCPVQRGQAPFPTEIEGLPKPRLQKCTQAGLPTIRMETAMHWCLQPCYTSQYEGTNTPVKLTPHHSLARNLGKDRVKLSRDRRGQVGCDLGGAWEDTVTTCTGQCHKGMSTESWADRPWRGRILATFMHRVWSWRDGQWPCQRFGFCKISPPTPRFHPLPNAASRQIRGRQVLEEDCHRQPRPGGSATASVRAVTTP